MYKGKTDYFYGHGFNSKLLVISRGCTHPYPSILPIIISKKSHMKPY